MNWKKNRLAIAAVVFVAVLGAAISITRKQHAPAAEDPSVAFEAPAREDIQAIEITRPSGEKVRLEKRDGALRIVAPIDAEAEKSAADALLDRLSELSIRGIAATRPENHARLEVDDANGIRVLVETKAGKPIELRLGTYRSGSTMVRIGNEDQVRMAQGSLKHVFNKELREWRNRQVVEVSPDDVREVRFDHGTESLHFARGEDGTWAQGPGQKAIERFHSDQVQSVVSTLARLRTVDFADARPSEDVSGLGEGASRAVLTVATSKEGEAPTTETITLRLGKQAEGKTEVYLEREGDPQLYLVSKFVEQSIRPERSRFQKPDEQAAAPSAAPAPDAEPMNNDEMRRFVEAELAKRRAGGH